METQENQEPQEPQELTIEEKLAQIVIFPRNLLEVSEIPVKNLTDILGLEVKGSSYYYGPKDEEVTIRQELVKLHQLLTDEYEIRKRYFDEKVALQNKIDRLETYLDENWDDIDEEVRDEICDIFGFEQEVTKYVTIKVEGTVEVKAPRGYDWDNIGEDIDYEIALSYTNSDLEEVGYGFDASDFSAEAD